MLTGIAVARHIKGKIEIVSEVVVTDVHFSVLTDKEVSQYVLSGEPMGKAGAYGIQGKAALFVEYIQGSYTNVVGLPLAETGKLLQRFNVPVFR